MPEKDKKLIQRSCHGAAAVAVNSDCVEVILFGGYNVSLIADTVAVRFGERFSVLNFECYLCLIVSFMVLAFPTIYYCPQDKVSPIS